MLAHAEPAPRWRSWLLLIFSSIGVLLSFMAGVLLLLTGGYALANLPLPTINALSLLNFAWVMLLVGVLCLPAVVYSLFELRGTPIPARANRKLFLAASAGMLVWALLVILFETVETSQQAWLLLPPMVLLTAVLPLWWFVETGRRGLSPEPPVRTWGIASFSLLITLPVILMLELILLLLLVLAGGLYLSTQPGFAQQLAILEGLLSDPNFDPQILNDMLMGWLQQPGVVFGVLVVVSGIVPLIEELFKPLAVWLFAGDRLTPAQGFTAGMVSGACFALWENLTALSTAGDGSGTFILVARVGTGLLHIVTSGLVGWGLASFWQSRRHLGRMLGMYFLAVSLHGLWNAAGVVSGFAPMLQFSLEASNLPRVIQSSAVGVLVALIIVIFALLLYANARLHRLQAVESAALAPSSAPFHSDIASPEPASTSVNIIEGDQVKNTGDPHGVD